ncbi:helix-turn-helix domain-containing protein [Epilithonimonas caeni]|uniref:helix-turn-helix domain-containing protein n=1 Tax=Epilithonimonas caeni TaxID=365343 RepID=UPI000402B88C|nr:helix-turn-helix transcriptional regulator [Epilithonimonas caeni]
MENKIIHIKTIADGHKAQQLPPPAHPLISIVNCQDMHPRKVGLPGVRVMLDLYTISLKTDCDKIPYGQQKYDFDEGMMAFMGPNQLLGVRDNLDAPQPKGWMMFIHPDFFWNTSLAKKIKEYEFFQYSVNEALFLSEKEQAIINGIADNIRSEYYSNIDKFSKQIIVSHLENLLSYAERFYNRQFITREKSNHQILDRLSVLLNDYFNGDDLVTRGLPSVQHISEQLNVSTNYLRGLLKMLTGQNTQHYIHEKLIDKAKEKLSTTSLSVSEIAYELGFEHSQSFSKLFKTKTNQTPLEFRASFN